MATTQDRKELANAILIIANVRGVELKATQRKRLNMMAEGGWSPKVIAGAEGVTVRAVERSLRDAQEKIKETLPVSLR